MKLFYHLIAILMLTCPVQAEVVTTLQLNNRPAAEVIPIIEPMLAVGDRISGHGFKIFLRSSEETLALVEDMIEAIDIASKVLQISVLQGSARKLRSLGLSGSMSISNNNASVNISGTASQQQLQNNPVHRLRVTEGTEGFIETGKEIALFAGSSRIKSIGTEFKKVTTGFYVLPRVHGENVTLQVSPFKNVQSHAGGSSINTQHANTTISGRLGEWLLVGGVSEQVKRSQSGTSGYNSTQGSSDDSIWIKAEVIQ